MLYAIKGIYLYANYGIHIEMNKKLKIFKALSDETKIRIINLFIRSGQEICVCEIMDALQISQYTISKALAVLKEAGFLTTEKNGLWVYYKLNRDYSENIKLFNFLKIFLDDGVFQEDEKRLNDRLLLRENDKCVVGIVPQEDLHRMIKEKTKA